MKGDITYLPSRDILRMLSGAFYRLEARGTANVPSSGPAVLISSHGSYLDPPVVAIACPRPVRFMAWSALFKIPPIAAFARHWGSFPINLESADRAAYKKTLDLLDQGELVCVFPQGGRSETGLITRMMEGGPRIARRAGVPVVPVSIAGAQAAWPRERLLPRTGLKIIVRFHPPVGPNDLQKKDAGDTIQRIVNSGVVDMEREIRSRFRPL